MGVPRASCRANERMRRQQTSWARKLGPHPEDYLIYQPEEEKMPNWLWIGLGIVLGIVGVIVTVVAYLVRHPMIR